MPRHRGHRKHRGFPSEAPRMNLSVNSALCGSIRFEKAPPPQASSPSNGCQSVQPSPEIEIPWRDEIEIEIGIESGAVWRLALRHRAIRNPELVSPSTSSAGLRGQSVLFRNVHPHSAPLLQFTARDRQESIDRFATRSTRHVVANIGT